MTSAAGRPLRFALARGLRPAAPARAQLMAVGGNHKARQFFKQHGWDETGSDKIESKVSCAGGGCWGGGPSCLTLGPNRQGRRIRQ